MSLMTKLSLAAAVAWLPLPQDGASAALLEAKALVEGQQAGRPVIGVTTSVPGPTLAAQLRLAEGSGLVIDDVLPGLPAAEAGMAVHDVLVAIDGREPVTIEHLREAVLRHHEAGDALAVVVLRGGDRLSLSVGVTTQKYDERSARLGDAWRELALARSDAELEYAQLLERSELERLMAEKAALAARAEELQAAREAELNAQEAAEVLGAQARKLQALQSMKEAEELRRQAELQARELEAEGGSVAAAKKLMAQLKAEVGARQAELESQEAASAARVAELQAKLKAVARQSQAGADVAERFLFPQARGGGMAIVGDGDGDAGTLKRLIYERSQAQDGDSGSSDARLAAIEERLARMEKLLAQLVDSIR